jgi:SOS response regulatory protein OraA/RecX
MLGRDRIDDDKEFQRLYRYLLNQGFDGERVMSALQARRKK